LVMTQEHGLRMRVLAMAPGLPSVLRDIRPIVLR
jgi:hypothetical protein